MSQWTHIAGCIRFDGIPQIGQKPPELGNTCKFDSEQDSWDACDVPMGSEGSMRYDLVETDMGLSAWSAQFFGDLRDYGSTEDIDKIIEYFKRITKGKMIRQGTYVIDVEGGPTMAFCWDDEAEEFQMVLDAEHVE